jgi:antitoxin ParD1/3/4
MNTRSSEYLHEPIRKDQPRTQLRALLLEGAASPPGSELTDAYIDGLKERIRARGGNDGDGA